MNYADYSGPSGQCAVIGDELVPLDLAAIDALAQNAMLLALGDPAYVQALSSEAAAAAAARPQPASITA